jgi:hypothetical protein
MQRIINKLSVFISFISLLSCNSENNNGKESNAEKETKTINTNPSDSKTFLTAEIGGKAFTVSANVNAIEAEGQYYVVGGENDDFAIAFHIPKNAATGSKITEASVSVKKPSPQLYNAGLAAVTIERITDKEVSGTFTFIAKTGNEKLINVKNGKFTALFLKP